MGRTRIEWCDYTINPVKGICPMHCKNLEGYEYCYAAGERGLYKRFKWNPEIRYNDTAMLRNIPNKPSRIFVGSTFELFGDWVKPEWLEDIFDFCREYERQGEKHTFIFLTKQSEELLRWSPFPPNCHIGVSVTNQEMHNKAIACLAGIKASVKFISYEPLLSEINLSGAYDLSELQWVIIGQVTPAKKATMPKIEWVREIVEAADKAGIPVFQKNNLRTLLGDNLRQEFPLYAPQTI